MHRSTEYCINLPDDFPDGPLAQYMLVARSVLLEPTKSAQWTEFAGASNLIAWRYRATHEHWLYYKTSLVEHSNPDHEELYRRELALFGMFTTGVSCVEATCYSIAALASHPTVLGLSFGQAEQRKCSPARLHQWLLPYGKATSVVSALAPLLDSHEWQIWVDLRNRMTHRSNLPRVVHGAAGMTPSPTKPLHFAATSSTPALEADAADFDALLSWLTRSLEALLAAGASLP